jgi:hypothetical protein
MLGLLSSPLGQRGIDGARKSLSLCRYPNNISVFLWSSGNPVSFSCRASCELTFFSSSCMELIREIQGYRFLAVNDVSLRSKHAFYCSEQFLK